MKDDDWISVKDAMPEDVLPIREKKKQGWMKRYYTDYVLVYSPEHPEQVYSCIRSRYEGTDVFAWSGGLNFPTYSITHWRRMDAIKPLPDKK